MRKPGKPARTRNWPSISATPPNWRAIAADALRAYRLESEFISRSVDALCRAVDADSQIRAAARELAAGVVRRQATLDRVISRVVNRPRGNVEDPLWCLLQIGAYQLLLMDGIPPHSAVDETVKLAHLANRPGWAGVLNGSLRALTRLITDQTGTSPAANAVPLASDRYRLLSEAVFPEPSTHFDQHVSAAFSYPRWLVRRWRDQWDEAETIRLCHWFSSPGALGLRVNALRCGTADLAACRDTLAQRLQEDGIAASAGELPESIRIAGTVATGRLPGLSAGEYSVQDESAMNAVALLDPQPGETILDLCAAPGGKATHIAERMRNAGRVIATDISAERLQLVTENAERLGITCIEPQLIARDSHDVPDGPFDAVLLDAPCSNTGVLGKRPEARWRIRTGDIDELVSLQQRLLQAAMDRVKPGGRLVYSTCSIDPAENGVAAVVAQARSGWHVREQPLWRPGEPADGGGQTLLIRDHT